MKKLTIIFLVLFVTGLLFAGGQSEGVGEEITGLSWDWNGQNLVNDHDRGGSSTIEMVSTTNGIYRFTGSVTTKYAFGFAGFFVNPADDHTLQALKRAKAFSFKVKGDGLMYAAKIATSDITDFAFHEKQFRTEKDQELTVFIRVNELMQPNWGIVKKFRQENAMSVNFQTATGGRRANFDITVWDLKLYE